MRVNFGMGQKLTLKEGGNIEKQSIHILFVYNYCFFWNAYKRLEKEVLILSEDIHFSDDQLGVYSSKIGDLLVRIAIEVESLSKVLYLANGGTMPTDRDLYFDTDCMNVYVNRSNCINAEVYNRNKLISKVMKMKNKDDQKVNHPK